MSGVMGFGLCRALVGGIVLNALVPTISFAKEIPASGAQVWKVPERAARVANPVKPEPRSMAEAKKIYINECLVCHGPSGRGDGSKAPDLTTHPGDFSDPKMMQQTDGELFWKITRGKTPMPAYRTKFTDSQRWAMVNYLRTFIDARGATATNSSRVDGTRPSESTQPATNQPPPKVEPKATGPSAAATPQPIDTSQFVSREEYQKLKADYDNLRREIDAIKAQVNSSANVAALNTASNLAAARAAATEGEMDELAKELEEAREEVKQLTPGTTKSLLSGFASAGFVSRQHGDAAFSANFAPLFLWKLSDRLLFEGELDVTLEDNDTEFDLKRAHITYLINDYVTFGAGRFLSPMNFLEDRLHQVTKLPDKPLPIQRLLPESNVGLQLRGAVPIGETKLGYAFYVANAPAIETQNGVDQGRLQFDNFSNVDGHVAVGGRVGFYPIPQLEVGYGFQISGVGGVSQGADALLHSVDLSYVRDSQLLKGTVNLLAQWAWSQVDSTIFDPATATFNNRRNGGYVQLAYRPTMMRNRIVSRLEPVVRYERFNQKRTAAGFDEQRWSLGLNYWLGPSAVFKVAYQFDDRSDGQDQDAILAQFKVGY
jgi:mono/diheme cytochrome c family protein